MSLKSVVLALLSGTLLASSAFAQKREYIQLQRDMALLQEALRQIDQNNSDRLTALETLLKQGGEKQDKLVVGQAVIERSLAALDEALTEPQKVTSAKVDSLTSQFSSLRATVEEMGASVERLAADVRDIKTHLTTLPPPLEGEMEGDSAATDVNSSDAIFEGGLSDYTRGNLDTARGQFMDYLALYPTHAKAGAAQYYLAETYYSAADYEEAAKQFGLVYKRYPLSTNAPDALYKQGMALLKLRQNDAATEVFESVIKRFPETSAANLARAELNGLLNSKPSPGL